jgi:hypothetical protein
MSSPMTSRTPFSLTASVESSCLAVLKPAWAGPMIRK